MPMVEFRSDDRGLLSDLAGASEVKYAEVQHHSALDGAARARVGASGVAHVRDQATGYRKWRDR
jgi:hypothetical protein